MVGGCCRWDRRMGRWRRRGLFRLGHRHCFTVDENLICATKRAPTMGNVDDRREGRATGVQRGEGRRAGKGESGGSDGCCLV